MGVEPDIVVDNNPRTSYDGKDEQLERAISELKDWLDREPVVVPQPPPYKKTMTMSGRECRAT
jgi:tricorn protease